MSAAVLEALKKFDPANDGHWTVTGDAKLDTLKFFNAGVAVSREELEKIAPGFNRDALRAAMIPPPPPPSVMIPPPPPPETANGTQTAGAGPAEIKTEQPVVELRPASGEAEIEALAEEVGSANEAVNECQRLYEEAGRNLKAAQAVHDSLIARLENRRKDTPRENEIQRYLHSQIAIGRARGKKIQAIRASGLDVGAINKALSASPIDQALASKRRR